MRSRFLLMCAVIALGAGPLLAQITGDVIGIHDLSPGSSSPITGARPGSCNYCHAPHSGLASGKALWNQSLTHQAYDLYTSSTYHQTGTQPLLGSDSNLCLSCHDGSVAVGLTIVGGQIATTGSMYPGDVFGKNLQSSHPLSIAPPIQDAANLVATLAANGQTADPNGKIKLINGNIECTTCHNAHVQAKDRTAQKFLVIDSSSGAMCLSCHDPSRVVQGQTNPLAGWASSIHATSGTTVQNLPYPSLAMNACFSCHQDHNAAGAAGLLRGAGDQVCLNCHGGAAAVATPALANFPGHNPVVATPSVVGPAKAVARLNVAAQYAKIGHPLSTRNVELPTYAASRTRTDMPTASPRTPDQSGCINCHDPHAVGSGTGAAVAPAAGATQRGLAGVSETDGVTVVRPARAQYQICLRCHGAQSQATKDTARYGYRVARLASASNPQNVIPQFGATAGSSHPVFRPRRSSLVQPSLLANMWDLTGTTQGRVIGTQILCTDCHNSDDNREFGGTGASGPHGSKWQHILERRYEFSQSPQPGLQVTNLFPSPDLSANGPYALCGKCHNLANIVQNASFAQHARHINVGFSCSTCHSAHGVASSSGNSSGQRLISFDANVVAPNGGAPASYTQGANTCTLTCHNAVHNADGTVTLAGRGLAVKR